MPRVEDPDLGPIATRGRVRGRARPDLDPPPRAGRGRTAPPPRPRLRDRGRRRRPDRRRAGPGHRRRVRRVHRGAGEARARATFLRAGGVERAVNVGTHAVPDGHRRAQARRHSTWACSSATSCGTRRRSRRTRSRRRSTTTRSRSRELDAAAEPRPRTRSRDLGIGHGDRVAWWGETSLAVARALRRPREARRGVRAGERPARARTRRDDPRLRAARARRHRRRRAESIAGSGLVAHHARRLAGLATRRRPRARARRARSARHLLHQRQHRRARRASCSRTGSNCLRSFPSLGAERDGGTVCMFPLFHMAGWSLALGAWQARRPIHLVRTPRRRRRCSASRRGAGATRIYAIPAVWARILEHGLDGVRPRRRCARPTPARRRRRPSSSTRSAPRSPTR